MQVHDISASDALEKWNGSFGALMPEATGPGDQARLPRPQHRLLEVRGHLNQPKGQLRLGERRRGNRGREGSTAERDFAIEFCRKIKDLGYWADLIDPCSGLPMLSGGNKVYSEVDGMQLVLKYQVMNAGFCSVLIHPRWGSSVYPASCFSNAPPSVILSMLEKYN
mmetsp:Transcript_8833/g.12417  ORF Transcript_8833/g.12417 Transcript_8833/m.12417 type:complete len:166 (-) Transcript_8833:64-561(-)